MGEVSAVNPVKEHVDITDFPIQRSLQLNNCGIKRETRLDYTILRSKGRHDYHFLYVHSGWLTIEIDDKTYRVESGQCVVYFPGVKQRYTFLTEGNSTVYYLYFTGTCVDEVMTYLKPRKDYIYTITDRTTFEGLFHRILSLHNTKDATYILEENAVLLQIISIVCKSSLQLKPSSRQSDIMIACNYMQEHFREQIDLKECASKLHFSLSNFSHLFTKAIGQSPYKYILNLRIDEAKSLLKYSSMNIQEVAIIVGFKDPLYFGRLFRKYTGLSPSEYRQQYSDNE